MRNVIFICIVLLLSASSIKAGPLAYGICQTGCNAMVVACYAAAGFTFGTVTAGAGVPAAIIACNVALGTCMAACVAAGCAPTP
ncbi:CLUMA_CG000612, isoform A [Clunio marinus]|uniref:CLUMA_CG000612, isoform A n=1 Tax=Clunio marinus TaxID=568069 RepID=A0A1J1HFI7_9DIPT|nr:CLUMA_CG000612, isoform A [Clunio marinus]